MYLTLKSRVDNAYHDNNAPQVCWKRFGLAYRQGYSGSNSKSRSRGNLPDACHFPQLKHLLTIDQQLIALWQKYKDRDDDLFLWGDEVMIFRIEKA